MSSQLAPEFDELQKRLNKVNETFVSQKYDDLLSVFLWHLIPIVIILAISLSIKKMAKSPRERNIYFWLMITGAFVQVFYCGIIVTLKQCQPMRDMFQIIDERLVKAGSVIHLLAKFDLVLIGPLSLITAIMFATSKKLLKEVLLIIISTVNIFGCLAIFVDEIFTNDYKDVCGKERFCYKIFNFHNIVVFWIGFVGFYLGNIMISSYLVYSSSKILLSAERQEQTPEKSAEKKPDDGKKKQAQEEKKSKKKNQ